MIKLRESLLNMESRLFRDIYNLQLLIKDILPSHLQHNYQPRFDYFYQNEPRRIENQYPYASKREDSVPSPKDILSSTSPATSTTTTATTIPTLVTTSFKQIETKPQLLPQVVNVNKLKSLETRSNDKKPQKEKNTMNPKKNSNQYEYYWKLDHFSKKFQHAKKNEIFSHVFNVKGIFLRIRAILLFSDNDNLLLDIEHLANIDNSEKMEIEISDGIIFKEIAEEKLFHYSFSVLNQNNPNHDLISPVYWNNDNDNYLIPNSIHLLSNYLKDDSLLVKLTISF